LNRIKIVKEGQMFRKWDTVIIVIVVIAVLAFTLSENPQGETVNVSLDGKTLYSLSLDSDRTVVIDGVGTIIIENSTVRIEDADCPDKLCEQIGRISKAGQSIICLPNKLIITITGESEWDIIV